MKFAILKPLAIAISSVTIVFLFLHDIELYFSSLLNDLTGSPFLYAVVSFCVLTSDILLPVPSSIVMYSNGYVLGTAYGALISILSLILGAVIGYYLGLKTLSVGKRNIKPEATLFIEKYGLLAVLLTRGIPILAESICFVCGYNGMPFKQYIIYNIIGLLPVTFLFSFCGSQGYDNSSFLLTMIISLFISLVFWLVGKRLLRVKSV